jgi:hypothetical protein
MIERPIIYKKDSPSYEYIDHDGLVYSRFLYEDGPGFFQMEYNQDLQDKPEVLCECGCTAFTLRYGYYEIRARCTNCGIEHEVYSG